MLSLAAVAAAVVQAAPAATPFGTTGTVFVVIGARSCG